MLKQILFCVQIISQEDCSDSKNNLIRKQKERENLFPNHFSNLYILSYTIWLGKSTDKISGPFNVLDPCPLGQVVNCGRVGM